MDDDQDQWTRSFLEPLRAQSSESFVQDVMRRVRAEERPSTGIDWPAFARWAFPALAFSVSSFAAAMLYTVQPAGAAADLILMGAREQSYSAEWLPQPNDEDQILEALVVKP